MSGAAGKARASRLALLASCLALAVPAALAAPYIGSGEAVVGHGEDAWLAAPGQGWQMAVPAYAQSPAIDDDLEPDIYESPLIVGPNQVNITYTKSASAGPSAYAVYAGTYLDEDYVLRFGDQRNVTAVAGNGTMVHTLTFDGPALAKDTDGGAYSNSITGTTFAAVLVGDVTNDTGALWVEWTAEWRDADENLYGVLYPNDGQRPAVSSARLTGQNQTVAVWYDERVWYRTVADYSVMLANGTEVAVETVLDTAGNVIRPNYRSDASAIHVLSLNASLTLDDIDSVRIARQNITDTANGTSGNALVNETAGVIEGYPPRPLSAAITGPWQITVTFNEAANSSPANYPEFEIWPDALVASGAPNRTVVRVDGNGASVHTLTLNMSDPAIPLLTRGSSGAAAGWALVAGASDTKGNTMGQHVAVDLADERTREGMPQLVAARFTGPNEVTVSYNNRASIPDGGYAVAASWESLRNRDASSTPDLASYELNYTVTLPNGTEVRPALDYGILSVASVSGNGTAVHTLSLEGDGVAADANGLINITGLMGADGARVGDYVDAAVYDEQLMRVASAWWNGNTSTIFVEYGEPARGPLSAYAAAVRGYDDSRSAAEERRDVASVTVGNLAVMKDSVRLIGTDLATDEDRYARFAMGYNNTLHGWNLAGAMAAGGTVGGTNASSSNYTSGMLVSGTVTGGALTIGTLASDTVAAGSVAGGAFNASIAGAGITGANFAGTVSINGTEVSATLSDVTIVGASLTNARIDSSTGGKLVVYIDGNGASLSSQANILYINGSFTANRITFERPTHETIIVPKAPSLLNMSSVAGEVGYTGQLVLLSGKTIDVRAEPSSAKIDGYFSTLQGAGANQSARLSLMAGLAGSLYVDDGVWLVTPAAYMDYPGARAKASLHSTTVHYDPKEAVVPQYRMMLDGTTYFEPDVIETAAGCMVPERGAGAADGCDGHRVFGRVHMVALEGPAPDSMLNGTRSGLLTVSSNVSGANGNPVEAIGVAYLPPSGTPYHWQIPDRQNPERAATNVSALARSLADFGTSRLAVNPAAALPLGANSYIPWWNPSLHVNDKDIVLQMHFSEPVDAQSIDPSRAVVTIRQLGIGFNILEICNANSSVVLEGACTYSEDVAGPVRPGLPTYKAGSDIQFRLADKTRSDGSSAVVTAVTDRLVTLKLEDKSWTYERWGKNITIPLSYVLDFVNRGVGVTVTIESGFATSASGLPIGTGTYNAWTSRLPAQAAVASIAMTGSNTFLVRYSDPLYATYENLVLEPGGNRSVTSVGGDGTKRHVVTFDGVPVPPTAGGSVTILGKDTTAGVVDAWRLPNGTTKEPVRHVQGIIDSTSRTAPYPVGLAGNSATAYYNGTVWIFPDGNMTARAETAGGPVFNFANTVGTGYVPGVAQNEIGPLRPAEAARSGSGAVSIQMSGITSGNEIAVVYTGPVAASAADYTGLVLEPGGPRNVTGVADNGTARHVVTFDGQAAQANATGTIDIAALVGPGGFARFAGITGQALDDMQMQPVAVTPPATPPVPPRVEATPEVGHPMISSTGRQLVVVYEGPVNATAADYNITRVPGASAVAITEMRGNATVHVLDHEIQANGTALKVDIKYLDDEGAGRVYAGTTVAVFVDWSAMSPFPPASRVADHVSSMSDGRSLTVTYTNPVDAAAADYEITRSDGTPVAITGMSGSGTAVHTLAHSGLPRNELIHVRISPLDDESSGFVYRGGQFTALTSGSGIVDPTDPIDPTDPPAPTVATASAVFTGKNTVRITYSAPLGPPAAYTGPVYGDIVLADGTRMTPVDGGVSGLGTAVHTIKFGGDGVSIDQTGTIGLNTDLVGRAGDGTVSMFTSDTIDVMAGTGARTAMPTGQMPVVAIERDGFVRVVNVVDGGDMVRPSINITSLADGALVPGSTVTLPDSGGSTAIVASFAEVSFPPNVTATSVPADGLLELYVSSQNVGASVAAALSVSASGLEVRRVVQVGDDSTHIIFDMPVRIVLSGQAAGTAFYINNTDSAAMLINTVCEEDDTAAVHAQLGGMGECASDIGGDKVIYTYHLTLFGTARTPTALESLVAAAEPGAVVKVPAGMLETDVLRVNKSLTIEPADLEDPPVFTGYSRIIVQASADTGGEKVVIRGLTFKDTEHTSGADGLASIIVMSEARAGAAGTLQVTIEGNTFRNTCNTAVRAAAEAGAPPIAGLTIRDNMFYGIGGNSDACMPSSSAPNRADAIVAGRHGQFTADTVQLANMTVQDNYVFGTTYTGMRIAGADGLAVTGNHIEGVPDDGIRILPSRDVQVHLNTIVDANSAPHMAQGSSGVSGAAVEVWSGSDDVAVTLNRISSSAGAFSICSGMCDPGADAADGTVGIPVPVGRAAVNSADGGNDVRFNHNVLARSNTGMLVDNKALGALNARANYYPGYAAAAADRISAGVSSVPILGDAGPVRIGAIVADGAASPTRSIDAAVGAAFTLGVHNYNARQSEVGGVVGLEPAVHAVGSPGRAAAAEHASAVDALRSGSSADSRMLPVLHNSISSAMAAYDAAGSGSLAEISAMQAAYGHYPFVNARNGTIVAHGANASLVGDSQAVLALAGGTRASLDALFNFDVAGVAQGVAPGHPGAPWKWWTYEFTDPATGEAASKRTAIALHPGPDGTLHNGDDLVFGAGYYPGAGAAHLVVAAGDAPAAANASSDMVIVSPASTAAQLAVPDMMFRLAPPDSKLAGVVLDRAAAGFAPRSGTVVVLNDSASLQSIGLAGELDKIRAMDALPDGVSTVTIVSYDSSAADGWASGAARSISSALSLGQAAAVYSGRADAFAALAGAFGASPPSGKWYATGELARAELAASGPAAALARAVQLEALLQHAAPNAAIDAALSAPGVGIALDESTRGPAYAAYDAPSLLGRAISSMPAGQGTPAAEVAMAIKDDVARTHAGALGSPLILDRNGDLVLPIEYAVSSFPAADGDAWGQGPRLTGELTCGLLLERRVLDFGSLALGQHSRIATQTVVNTGTIPYASVALDATEWMYDDVPGADPLPATITELRELGQATTFADIGPRSMVASGLGPGMDRDVQYRIDLTGYTSLPVGQVMQTVNYLVSCASVNGDGS